MRKLLNTLFVTTPETYLALDGENIVILKAETKLGRVPLHNLEAIVTTGYLGASPALMRKCAEKNIGLTFLTTTGKFGSRVTGGTTGNVTLRKKQYRISDNEEASLAIAKHFIIGKLYNQRWMLERVTRDNPMRIDVERFKQISGELKKYIGDIRHVGDLESLRGIEGQAANRYFLLFDQMILQQKVDFGFYGRNRRPPLDNVNAMLSLAYTLLAQECAAALETVGLDPYVGFMHQDRPGRASLSLDLMEELRGIYADRFVLTLINKKMITGKDFLKKESGAVILTDEGRRRFFQHWQEKKQESIQHPFLGEKINWGLVPYVQALLLSRFLRDDLDGYPPFLWK
ncbi:type I-C CRISPR-associated endonuclease Cas1c [Enterococcus sp. AZ126]|uniref:type I-C CRISPR-associated endonuclease Cas1c n=1 Tax=Enterococcus sp. AZ126 TaxID=2774635 RepID=UPI003F24481E